MPSLHSEKQTIESHYELVEYLELGCKPKSDWRIGTEHEKFGYSKQNFLPLPYNGECSIEAILKGLKNNYGWEELFESGYLIGLSKNGANVTLEPGGQLELSGALLNTIHETCAEVTQHLAEVNSLAKSIGAGFIGFGAAPIWKHSDMPIMPKGRYKLMTPYMDSVGTHGKEMMYRTCTVQVNLDFSSESDMKRKMRLALALQPIATALFAASPFFEGKVSDYQSWRSRIWQDTDNARTGMIPFVFDDGFGFEAWAKYALDVPMYFVYRDGTYINALGQSFRHFLNGELPALPGEKPLLSDWVDHLTTIFPEIRLKQFIEMRGADSGPADKICALPAFWVGLLYDSHALDSAWDLCKNWTEKDREKLRIDSAKSGLRANIRGKNVLDIAKELVEISMMGLRNRAYKSGNYDGDDESKFLQNLLEITESGQSLSDELLKKYYGDWKMNINHIYNDYSY